MSQLTLYRTSLSLAILATLTVTATTHAKTSTKSSTRASTRTSLKTTVIPVDQQTLLTCSKITDNVARLACFDKISVGKIEPEAKAPLDIAKTLEVSIKKGKAVPVLAVDQTATVTTTTTTITKNEQKKLDNLVPNKLDKTILKQVGVTAADVEKYTPLSVLYDLDKNDPKGILTIRPHLPMYVMPLWYNATPNYDIHSPTRQAEPFTKDSLQHLDSKLQISMKTKLAQDVFDTNADVWLGYTQQSYWQVYNGKYSRPFRSSDYQPEIFLTQPIKGNLPGNGSLRLLGAGLVHESNGQSDPLSRSWNRIYAMAGTEWGKLTVIPRLWLIANENSKDSDNPDIGDYMGYGDVRWLYPLNDQSTVGGVMRYNPSTNKGAIQVDYAYPLTGGMKAILQVFHGYGENIQDYNHKSTNVGIGIMFNDFKGL
ncbi:phospholipase A [Moraxella osloensis]|nr:phospholipase A [Moraxella osloensis]MBW4019135.1 phospholipase A [Moraxella osloensis]